MNTIYKYPIEIVNTQTIKIKESAEILHVGLDPQGVPCIWAKVNTSFDDKDFKLCITGTGFLLHEGIKQHLGTFVQHSYVWHVFSL